jgi:hypothetical protein
VKSLIPPAPPLHTTIAFVPLYRIEIRYLTFSSQSSRFHGVADYGRSILLRRSFDSGAPSLVTRTFPLFGASISVSNYPGWKYPKPPLDLPFPIHKIAPAALGPLHFLYPASSESCILRLPLQPSSSSHDIRPVFNIRFGCKFFTWSHPSV